MQSKCSLQPSLFESVSICKHEVIAISTTLPLSLPLTNPKYFVGKEKEVKVLTAKVNDAEKRHKMFKSPTGKQELYKTDFKIEGFFLGISKDLIFKLIFEKNLQTNS